MRKTETTRKFLNNNFRYVFQCGYCDLQFIMNNESAIYYNAGVYGWNFDVFVDYKNDIAITTGYRNMTGVTIPHELIKKYDDIARKILENRDFSSDAWTKKRIALDENRTNFFNELLTL